MLERPLERIAEGTDGDIGAFAHLARNLQQLVDEEPPGAVEDGDAVGRGAIVETYDDPRPVPLSAHEPGLYLQRRARTHREASVAAAVKRAPDFVLRLTRERA